MGFWGTIYIYNSQENLTKPQGLTISGRCWDIPRSGGAQFSYPRGYSKQGIFPPFPMGITDSLQPEQLEAWRPCGQMREVCKGNWWRHGDFCFLNSLDHMTSYDRVLVGLVSVAASLSTIYRRGVASFHRCHREVVSWALCEQGSYRWH